MTPFDIAMVGFRPRDRGEALARCAMRAGLQLQPGDKSIALEWANSSAENIEQVVAEARAIQERPR